MTTRRLEIFTNEKVCCAATRSVVYASLFKMTAHVDVIETSTHTIEGAARANTLAISKFPTLIIDGNVRIEPPLTPAAVAAALELHSESETQLSEGASRLTERNERAQS